jgi:hypothetical protein
LFRFHLNFGKVVDVPRHTPYADTLANLKIHIFKEKTMNRISCLTVALAALLLLFAAPATAGGGKKEITYNLVNNSEYVAVINGIDRGYQFDICKANPSDSCTCQTSRSFTQVFVQYQKSLHRYARVCTLEGTELRESLTISISKELQCNFSIK